MPSLREVQQGLGAALFDGDESAIGTLVRDDGIDALERVAIYRNNLREGFRKALALEFPVIERLVGPDYFRQLALEFLGAHPSRHGDLQHVGEPFPDYLRTRFAATEYRYFADVAALEWAHASVLVAPDSAAFLPDSLARLPPERHEELRLRIAPSCRLLQSEYPVSRIWQSNQTGAGGSAGTESEPVNLCAGPEWLLIRRGAAEVEFHAFDAATFAFTASLAAGQTLGSAFDAAQAEEADFDPGAALRRLVALGVVIAADHPELA
jgi:hypothetical protein